MIYTTLRKLATFAFVALFAVSVVAQVSIDTRTLFVPYEAAGKQETAQQTGFLRTTLLSHATAKSVFEQQNREVELKNFPLPGNQEGNLKLTLARPVVDANTEFYTHTKDGKVRMKVRPVVSYWGKVEGDPNSMVSVHYSDGNITGFVQQSNGQRTVIGRDFSVARSIGSTPHLIGEEATMFGVDPLTRFVCGSESMQINPDDMARKMSMPAAVKGVEGTQAEDLREFKIAVVLREDIDSVMKRRGETDEEVVQYFIKVVAAMAQVYAQELNVNLYMGYFEKYTQDEPSGYFYDGRQPGELLREFSSDWSRRMNNVDRVVAHLYALIRPAGGSFVGGIAFLDQLCNKKDRGGYGVSTVYLNAADVPGDPNKSNAFVWDVFVASHEMGHNIGSPHTHNCFWNPPVDTCQLSYAIDQTDGCFSDPAMKKVVPGTIMSYCHLANGSRTPLTFGSRVSERMRTWIKAAPCVPAATRPLVSLTEPRGTDSYQPNEKMSIRWASARVSSINIAWGQTVSGPWTSIATNVNAADQLYTWNVPALPVSEFWVRIEDASNPNVNDTSLAKYKMSVPVVLDAPKGGERIGAGSTYTIKWTKAAGVGNVKLEFSADGGTTFETISASATGNTLAWTVPSTNTEQARIRATAISSPSVPSTSGLFAIGQRRFALEIPVSGGKICKNQPNQYRWSSDYILGIKIQYTTDNGANWRTATQQSTIDPIVWQVFSRNVNMNGLVVGTKIKVRVIDATSEEVLDTKSDISVDSCASPVSVDELAGETPFAITMLTPNPASTSVRVSLASDKEFVATVMLVSMDGREVVLRADQRVLAGTHTIELPLSDMSGGSYRLVVREDNAQISAPLMIVR
ncbi:MAG: hypothetical protein FJ211_06360 [Ignavibacteria bacterium]|nr:hypothetical protein [Ignavibacteria bacterium]